MRRYYYGRRWPHVVVGLFVLWVISLVLFDTRDAVYGIPAELEPAMPTTTLVTMVIHPDDPELTLAELAELRSANATALNDYRELTSPSTLPPAPASEGEPEEVPEPPRELPPELTTTTTTTAAVTIVVESPPPLSECERVPNPGPVWLTAETMGWCPMVVGHLRLYDWQPGDLSWLLLIMECESNGIASAVNRSSGTAGLFQHRPIYWLDRSSKAGHPGDTMDPHLNIGTGVWLFKTGGAGHWDGCEPKIESTLAAMRAEL